MSSGVSDARARDDAMTTMGATTTRAMTMTTTTRSVRRRRRARTTTTSRGRRPGVDGDYYTARGTTTTTTTTTRATRETNGSSKGKTVVIWASGGVGQIVAATLASRGARVVAVSRGLRETTTTTTTTTGAEGNVETICGVDCRDIDAVERSGAFGEDVESVVCCLGTTAFPSARWRDAETGAFTNGPEATDYVSVRNVIETTKKMCPRLKRFVMVSSVGVLRTNVMPFIILNAFGVLRQKRRGEEHLENSTLPYTILRPGRLTDGPYTSYDLNTLLRATSGTKRAVQIGGGDDVLLPEATSRLVVAEAACAALQIESTVGRAFELGSTEGDGPGSDLEAWRALFDSA